MAQIGSVVLYKSDLNKVMPKGVSSSDSTLFAEQYINSWALKQLMLKKAEEQLPKNDKDVSKLLDEYRTQLLIFRYETKYVEERLDTLVTDQEKRAFYLKSPEFFITDNGVMRGHFIKIHNSSPNLQKIKALSKQNDEESIEKLEELAYNSAYKYDNYGNNWIDLSIVARDMDMDVSDLIEKIERKILIEQIDSTYSNFLQVIEYVSPGSVAPYEYNKEKIGDIILSQRKQELISILHKDIFNDAVSGKKIKFTKDENN